MENPNDGKLFWSKSEGATATLVNIAWNEINRTQKICIVCFRLHESKKLSNIFRDAYKCGLKKLLKKKTKTIINPKFSRTNDSSWERREIQPRRGIQRASDVPVTF